MLYIFIFHLLNVVYAIAVVCLFDYMEKLISSTGGKDDVYALLTNSSESLLHLASKAGKLDVVRYLIDDKNFPLDTITDAGLTPLGLSYQYNRQSTAEFLVYNGASVSMVRRKFFPTVERKTTALSTLIKSAPILWMDSMLETSYGVYLNGTDIEDIWRYYDSSISNEKFPAMNV